MGPTPIDRARLTTWLQGESPDLLRPWLPSQRWFGAKTRTIDAVGVEDVVWLPGERPSALLVLDIRYRHAPAEAGPHHDRYALVVSITPDTHGCPTIATLPWAADLRVVEAGTDGTAVRALLQGLVEGQPLPGTGGGGQLLYGDATRRACRLLTGDEAGQPAIVAIGLEQSNTSVRVGSTHVFKLFRRLEDGMHPELEIGRCLARVGFHASPPLEGSLVYRAGDGRECALGALQGWVDNEGDGWSYVVAQLERIARQGAAQADLNESLFRLGTTTADFHAAVASETEDAAFAPEVVTAADREAWRTEAAEQAERTLALIQRRASTWNEPAAALGQSLLGARAGIMARLRAPDTDAPDVFHKIRIHGDYHLGQTLRTQDGFAIIDFEGEPSRPLAARRSKECALKDVAGMLRSIDYAVASLQAGAPEADAGRLQAGQLRDAFLDGYRSQAAARASVCLPQTDGAFNGWIGVFELQKALYEVEYEANNRPTWLHIPLRSIGRLVAHSA